MRVAAPDRNGWGAGLLEQLPHGLAGGLPRHPAPHPLTDLAFLDCVIIPHQLGQGIQESSNSCRIPIRKLYGAGNADVRVMALIVHNGL